MNYLMTEFAQFGLQLRALRKARKLTQGDIHKITGYSPTLIIKIESGEPCSMAALIGYCDALEVKPMMALQLSDEDFKLLLK